MSEGEITRREFVRRTGVMAAGASLAAVGTDNSLAAGGQVAANRRALGANDKVRMALIGCGGQGNANMRNFMGHDDVEIVAVCDVDESHMAKSAADVEKKYGRKPATEKDFRRILDMKDVDAVIVGTPDHWHALPMIHACEAGKDVFVEKPISHDIVEGRAMVNAAKRFGNVVQVGTWQRSTQHYVDAMDYLHSGKLGKISVCRAWKTGLPGVGHQEPQPVPPGLDYDFWLGPAPKVAYRPNRCHYNFRWYYDYAAGMTGDWGVHMIDTVLIGMNSWHPSQVSSVGGKIVCGPQDDRDTPDTQIAVYKFRDPDFVLQWEVHVGKPGMDGGGDHGAEFIGTDGILQIDRGGWRVTDKDGHPKEKTTAAKVNDHWSNFLDCMRSREKPRSDIETMFYTTTACHLGNLAYRTGKTVEWDARTERVTNDKKIMEDQTYRREYRKPWKLPMYKVSA